MRKLLNSSKQIPIQYGNKLALNWFQGAAHDSARQGSAFQVRIQVNSKGEQTAFVAGYTIKSYTKLRKQRLANTYGGLTIINILLHHAALFNIYIIIDPVFREKLKRFVVHEPFLEELL